VSHYYRIPFGIKTPDTMDDLFVAAEKHHQQMDLSDA